MSRNTFLDPKQHNLNFKYLFKLVSFRAPRYNISFVHLNGLNERAQNDTQNTAVTWFWLSPFIWAPRTFPERNNPERKNPESVKILASYPDILTFVHPSPNLVPFPLT